MSDAMASLGWFRADRRRRGIVLRWRHVDGWVLRPAFPADTWALFDVDGVFVDVFHSPFAAAGHVARLDELDDEHAAAG